MAAVQIAVPIVTSEKNARGIPQLKFLEDITAFLNENKTTVEPVLESLQVMHQ